ncbi:hypothetical protein Brutus_00029 [Acinetobacter phage Brutus]|nr:hypothetical protein Brutus_00029 [Acinetobacter phage Brutus]
MFLVLGLHEHGMYPPRFKALRLHDLHIFSIKKAPSFDEASIQHVAYKFIISKNASKQNIITPKSAIPKS